MNQIEIGEDARESTPRPNGRKRLLIGSLVALPLCLLVPFGYFVFSSDQELQEAIAEADWLDPGWRIPELEKKRAVIPDKENSGLVLMAAKDLIPPNWPFWDHPQAPEKGERSEEELRDLQGIADLEPAVQLDERQTRALREELRRAEKALAAVQKVSDLPRGRYPITYKKDFISTLLPYTSQVRRIGTLLDYDALLRAQERDVDGALTSCRGLLNCGRSIGDEPMMISMLVRLASNAATTKKVERTLAQGEASESALSKMQHELEAEAEQPLLLIGARGERGTTDGAMQALQSGDLDPRFLATASGSKADYLEMFYVPGMAKGIRAALLKYNNRFVEIAKLPVEQQAKPIKELQEAEKALPQLARHNFAASMNVTGAFHRIQAQLRCAIVLLAVERYRRANHGWPDALIELSPAFLARIPLDPFDGTPLHYRRMDDGVVVYSIGPDGKDDGGKLDKNPTKPGTDLGLRLWNVSQRRQQPKPAEEWPKNDDE